MIAALARVLRAIQMPSGMPMITQTNTATNVTISVSMLSAQ